jgi:hypothetical protein
LVCKIAVERLLGMRNASWSRCVGLVTGVPAPSHRAGREGQQYNRGTSLNKQNRCIQVHALCILQVVFVNAVNRQHMLGSSTGAVQYRCFELGLCQ